MRRKWRAKRKKDKVKLRGEARWRKGGDREVEVKERRGRKVRGRRRRSIFPLRAVVEVEGEEGWISADFPTPFPPICQRVFAVDEVVVVVVVVVVTAAARNGLCASKSARVTALEK